jgi:energy-coupling factor transporter ATP-binding protein EcfA2
MSPGSAWKASAVDRLGVAPPADRVPRRGRLSAQELAEAVVLGDLTLALCLVGHLVPLASALFAAAVVPMAAVAARHRVRAVLAGGIAASVVAFLVAGTGLVVSVAGCTVLGAVVGWATRRAWGIGRTVLVGVVVLWPPAASAAIGALYLLSDLRRLTLAQVTNSWRGTSRTLRDLGVNWVAQVGDQVVRWAVRDWWATLPIAVLGAIAGSVALAWLIARPTLRRVQAAITEADRIAAPSDEGPPAPVPLRLHDIGYRYERSETLALDGVSLEILPGEFVTVIGPNGSGKSTLARILVGRRPTSGTVARPGAVALGHRHGSAIVFQRPEAQVLGVRVRDDIGWGLPADAPVDIDGILERVGLDGLADRETSTLSGGELQRLAVGAALAREPQLFVSDESTSMVDPAGRQKLVALLRQTSAEHGVAVVHVTHRRAELGVADRVLALEAGRPVPVPVLAAPPEPLPVGPAPLPAPTRDSVIQLCSAGHVYGWGTPWATRALEGIDLELESGEGLLVLGHNGSGKSTLAWILAGLLQPSEGSATLNGEPIDHAVGRVGLAFQHARLQLLRSTVANDIAAASGAGLEVVPTALASVGLDPAVFANRRVDELSGGEIRRAALAGILARHPGVIVLDEPFAGLDDAGRLALGRLLLRLRHDSGITVVIVSHGDDMPDGLINRVVELERGRVIRDAPVPGLPVAPGGRR